MTPHADTTAPPRDDAGAAPPPPPASGTSFLGRLHLERYLTSLGAVAFATAAAAGLKHSGLADAIVLVYLVAVLLVAWTLGRGPAVFTALLSVAAHGYFFVPPVFAFPPITDVRSWLTLATLLVAALAVGTLTSRLSATAGVAESRARAASALLAFSRELSRRRARESILRLAAEHAGRHFGGRALVVTVDDRGAVDRGTAENGPTVVSPAEADATRRALAGHGAVEGASDGPSLAASIAAPLEVEGLLLGTLVVRRPAEAPPLSPESRQILEGFARLTAEALERARLTDKAQRAEVDAKTERLRTSLLSSVSHDFRTPLAVILGATSHLAEQGDSLDSESRRELARTAEMEADRLNRLVGDLLSMTRLDAGVVRVAKEWQPLEDVVGSALARMERALAGRPLHLALPPDLPLVPLDAILIEQVLVNLLDNAVKHTPPGVAVEIGARADTPDEVVVEVIDHGPGVPAGEEESVFEPFRRGSTASSSGVGLGLAVCRGIVAVHGGRLWAENRTNGAAFRFTLPLEGVPPDAPASQTIASTESP